MKKQARLSYQEQAELLTLQGETIELQRRQLALQEVIFGKLFDFVQQLQQQWHTTEQDAKTLGQQNEG
jgi:hypothetical protein